MGVVWRSTGANWSRQDPASSYSGALSSGQAHHAPFCAAPSPAPADRGALACRGRGRVAFESPDCGLILGAPSRSLPIGNFSGSRIYILNDSISIGAPWIARKRCLFKVL